MQIWPLSLATSPFLPRSCWLLAAGCRLCAEAWVEDPELLRQQLEEAGLQVAAWQELAVSPVSGRRRVRLTAGGHVLASGQ